MVVFELPYSSHCEIQLSKYTPSCLFPLLFLAVFYCSPGNCLCLLEGGTQPGRVEPASPIRNEVVFMDNASWVVSTPKPPVPAPLHLLALQLKPNLPGL